MLITLLTKVVPRSRFVLIDESGFFYWKNIRRQKSALMESKYADKHYHYQVGRLPHHSGIREYFEQHYSAENAVLELGAGTGIGTLELANYFRVVVAVEPVAPMLDYGKSVIENSNVTFINAAVEHLDAHSLSYDCLICFQATHWFYESSVYRELYEKARQPVIDVCSFISFLADQAFFEELAQQYTIAQSNRGTKYPFDIDARYSYEKQIDVDHAAHQLCSRSWVDHKCFPQIREQIAERYGDENILTNIETRIHRVHGS